MEGRRVCQIVRCGVGEFLERRAGPEGREVGEGLRGLAAPAGADQPDGHLAILMDFLAEEIADGRETVPTALRHRLRRADHPLAVAVRQRRERSGPLHQEQADFRLVGGRFGLDRVVGVADAEFHV